MQLNRHRISLTLACLLLSVGCAPDVDTPAETYASKKGSYPLRTRHLDDGGEPLFVNLLVQEDSPYLLQHAHNPVNWRPWGEAAFAEARKLDKPVLLSIGYSTCHWCHVMERESFEDLKIAEFINQNFVAIKVDREEHPDIDEVYLTAVQMLSGKAGWPLTAVLTPDALPFFGGTYFPPDQFLGLLTKISDTWLQRRAAVLEQAGRLQTALAKINQVAGSANDIDQELLSTAQQKIQQSFESGQRVNEAAFPREPEMLFLLHRALAHLDPAPLNIVRQRLLDIAAGGIHDQLAGGFHRYTVDSEWQIPHFEKMLYNQAQLGQLYAAVHLQTGDPAMRAIAESTFDFMLNELQAPDGGFYAAIDAESEGREGAYYLWSDEQLRDVLDEAELALARTHFGISAQGNFEGYNILHRDPKTDQIPTSAAGNDFEALTRKLAALREQRTPPRTDTKIITAWNGMAISALLVGYQATGHERYLHAATRAAEAIWTDAFSDASGLARTAPAAGKRIAGALEDYAYFARALLDLYDLDGKQTWLKGAEAVIEKLLAHFSDDASGGFRISSAKDENKLFVALVTARDDAINSGNSIAAQVLARLYRRTGNIDYRRSALGVLSAFSKQLLNSPESLSGMLLAASILNQGELGSTQSGANGKVQIKSRIADDRLVLTIDIAPGWHINSYRVLESDLIPTALTPQTSHCATTGEADYPADQRVSLGFQEDELLVYSGSLNIHAPIQPPVDRSCRVLAAEFRFQACSDEVCLSPEIMQLRSFLPDKNQPAS